jgi:hypothetical protein
MSYPSPVRSAILLVVVVLGFVACRSSEERPAPEPLSAPPASAFDPELSKFCTACGGHEKLDEKAAVRASRAKPGDLARCPVSGAVFRVQPDSPIVEHAGKKAAVCCDGCKERFVQSPERFLALM